ncbi:MAG: SBBP repeat-containing protein [Clostridiales bacterium]|nr:SBBP repeat-containing protein [Clostridiales bacterium]
MQDIKTNPMLADRIKLPLSFVKNNGQEDQRVYFTTDFYDRRFFYSSDRITVVELETVDKPVPQSIYLSDPSEKSDKSLNGVALELSFINPNSNLIPVGVAQLEGFHHYLRGNESSKWLSCVPHYKELLYRSVWEGVDLEVTAIKDGMKMNWLMNKSDRVSSIRLHWAGAENLELDTAGNLLVHHALGTLTDLAPIAYQEIDGIRIPVNCAYRLYDKFEYGFELTGDYSTEVPLVIDPIFQYATYLGGSLIQIGESIAADDQGHAYVTGRTLSNNFPVTPGAFQTTSTGSSVFVTKFASDGETLIYSTYLGGNLTDHAYSISLDSQYCAYVTGSTDSTNFPVTPGAFQTTPGPIFITKIAPDGGSLVYSSFLGNGSGDAGFGIAVDAQGSAYITGRTGSTVLPSTPGAFQTTLPSTTSSSGFITKFSPDGSSLIYSTYLGGSNTDVSNGIAIDTQGHAYVTGTASSTDFPVTPGAFQTSFINNAVFVTKLSSDGGSLVYSTFLAGNGNDESRKIAVDTLNCASVIGFTSSTDFPVTPNAFQVTPGPSFVSKLSPTADSLIGSTYFDGDKIDISQDIKTDLQGHIYITGTTGSPSFPTTPNVLPSALNGFTDSFVSIFSADLTHLIVSYYLGGSSNEGGISIAVGSDGAVYTTGQTVSSNFPVTPGAFQTALNGINNIYVTKTAFAFYNQVSLNLVKLL